MSLLNYVIGVMQDINSGKENISILSETIEETNVIVRQLKQGRNSSIAQAFSFRLWNLFVSQTPKEVNRPPTYSLYVDVSVGIPVRFELKNENGFEVSSGDLELDFDADKRAFSVRFADGKWFEFDHRFKIDPKFHPLELNEVISEAILEAINR